MRPGQQNKRMRGRGGRRGPNPLSRNYESNGPDVKIRGSAAHIAEKYMQLARDANASGDPVAAESYLQHAEHYFRIIAAAQAQVQQNSANDAPQPRQRINGVDGRYDSEADDGDDYDADGQQQPAAAEATQGGAEAGEQQAAEAADGNDKTPPRRRRRRASGDDRAQAGHGANGSRVTNGSGHESDGEAPHAARAEETPRDPAGDVTAEDLSA